ncbi:AAA domain-containing protein [Lasiosphaeris hirsuta]|uniref:AAA domain-containing protein n=1 Tax=Lasiosphaeris hirsuta TaxID=260670 RepID=A0AA40B1U3_9PEZI|nr:AAA domain-containing protein [Lasiosphaeris hirsuta]
MATRGCGERSWRRGGFVGSLGSQRPSSPEAALFYQPREGRFRPPQQANGGKLREWRQPPNQVALVPRASSDQVRSFLVLGLELMDGDVGPAQEAIKQFSKDEGLNFIKEITDRHIPAFQGDDAPGVSITLWTTEQVAVLFNFLYGVSGDRMTRAFGFVMKLIESWSRSATAMSRMSAIQLSLAVLSKILDCNTTSIVNETVSRLADDFGRLLEEPPQEELVSDFSRLQASNTSDNGSKSARILHFSKHRPKPPSSQGSNGRRHDNDFAEISDIKILPTHEEIMSPRAEYLPTTDPSQWHIQGIQGRLDREFRLLREDTVGQLRDAVRETLGSIQEQRQVLQHQSKNGAHTYRYESPVPVKIDFDKNAGLELVIRCDQLTSVQKLHSVGKRREWWMRSKRLQAGSLVCVLDAGGSVLFCVVSVFTMRHKDDAKPGRHPGRNADMTVKAAEKIFTLSEDEEYLFVRLHLVDPREEEVAQALRWYKPEGRSLRRYLVEFPGVLLASFKDTLVALKEMYKKPNVPFSELLAPLGDSQSPADLQMNPPRDNDKDSDEDVDWNAGLAVSPQNLPALEEIASRSTLDPTQSSALLNTLSRELSLIQGPPGTGKSYTGEKIIKVLLDNRREAELGPILCVYYTNHALDQLLEHLLDDGIQIVIRIGSRSKSERLQDLNLKTVVREMDLGRGERTLTLERCEKACAEMLISTTTSWKRALPVTIPLTPRHTNEFEVDMTAALVSHLVRQGIYSQSDTAFITPYLGQLQRIRQKMESAFEICLNDRDLSEIEALEADISKEAREKWPKPQVGKTTLLKSIRLATVDNFQGEEAKVVIMCLVRNNPQKNCGFLRTSNRINVLLSRAQHGMYIIGNSETCMGVPMWADVIDMLKAGGNFGRCDQLLSCGHQCPSLCGESCPDAIYCQQCGLDNIMSRCVDFLEMREYHEIDLDEEPCVFPDCGHFLTVSSMDGQMDMAGGSGVKTCPTCRGSLRSVPRYGRIVRRVLLDESTKKFIAWSNGEYLRLVEKMVKEQRKLEQYPRPRRFPGQIPPSGNPLATLSYLTPRLRQLRQLQQSVGDDERYSSLIILWSDISQFGKMVQKEGQPFQRVSDLVKHANRQGTTKQEFLYDEAAIQVKGQLLAALLLAKCEIVVISDFVKLYSEDRRPASGKEKATVDWLIYTKDRTQLVDLARNTKHPREETQDPVLESPALSALWHIEEARTLMNEYPSTVILRKELDAVELMVDNGVVYREVSTEEIQDVYKAMQMINKMVFGFTTNIFTRAIEL